MLKSFLNWLVQTNPMHNWVLILILLGMLCCVACVFVSHFNWKDRKDGKENNLSV